MAINSKGVISSSEGGVWRKSKRHVIRFGLLALMAGALYLAFKDVNPGQILAELKKTNIALILLGLLLLFMSHLMRAWRWHVILRPVKPHTSIWVGFKAIMAGQAMNNVILRSGEVIRPYILAKHEKVFMSSGIATILVERVMDLLANILFIMLALIVFPREISHGFPSVANAMVPLAAGMVVLMILLLVMVFSANKTVSIIYKLSVKLPPKARTVVDRFAGEFANGLRGASAGGALPIVAGTLGIWLFYILSMYAWLFAFAEPSILSVGIIGAFFLRVVSGIAFLIPTPGGTGSYHYFISQALAHIFSVPLPTAIAYATLTHAAQYLGTTVTGLIILGTEGISLKNFRKVAKATEDHSAKELQEAIHDPAIKVGAFGIER